MSETDRRDAKPDDSMREPRRDDEGTPTGPGPKGKPVPAGEAIGELGDAVGGPA